MRLEMAMPVLLALMSTVGCKQILGIEHLSAIAEEDDVDAADDQAHAIPANCPIAFTVHSNDYTDADVLMASLDGEEVVTFAGGPGRQLDPAWSPDGERIAYAAPKDGGIDIYVYTPGTDQTDFIGTSSDDFTPIWSPDGASIAFTSYRTSTSQLFVMDADGQNVRAITDDASGIANAVWSPDGTRLAYTRIASGDITTAFVIDADGTNLVDMGPVYTYAPPLSWSPDGTQVVLSQDGNLAIKNADGTDPQVIATDINRETPAWSPDGARIVYSAGGNLVLSSADGSDPQVLTDTGYNVIPAWSPDSRAIVFHSFAGNSREVRVVDIFGRNRHTLYTTTDSNLTATVWSTACDTGIDSEVTIAESPDEPTRLVTDARHVYWVDRTANKIMRVDKAGGPVELVADSPPFPEELAVVGPYIYWVTASGFLMRATKTATNLVETLVPAGVNGAHLAADATHVYFGKDGGISRYAFAGGAIEQVVVDGGGINGIAVDDTDVYWSSYGSADSDTGTIQRAPKAGGPTETLATGQAQPWDVTVADGQVYWSNQTWGGTGPREGEATVMRADADGANITAVISGQTDCVGQVMVTDTRIWAACQKLIYVPRNTDGSIAPTVVENGYAFGLAIESQWIFTTRGDRKILQALKP